MDCKQVPDRQDPILVVAHFFLEIYRQQLKASRNNPAECHFLEEAADRDGSSIFELRILQGNAWKSRRMMIARLGDGSGSKSRCYYVIYDDHLVVKIPPAPIVDFSVYTNSILAEQKIAAGLKPRVCITPGVSVILKRVCPSCGFGVDTAHEEIEARYFKWLNDNPPFQEYLKIQGGFVFFMDLSKYFILADVLKAMHAGRDAELTGEMINNGELLWKPNEFGGRYGRGAVDVAEELQQLYREFETGLENIFHRENISIAANQYRFHDWFVHELAGKKARKEQAVYPASTREEMEQLFHAIVKKNVSAVERYYQTIRSFLQRKTFLQNKGKMSGIIYNILDLLAFLNRRGIALRDFKPDNILVAGDPGKYPHFLSDTQAFSLGLIDMETAIVMEADSVEGFGQPMLGGTPLYATPSQLVSNEILAQSLGDIRQIFFLQDWHAAMAMMYHVVTDEYLFKDTAKILPVIIQTIQEASRANDCSVDVFITVSRSYWQNAYSEFAYNTNRREHILKAVSIPVVGSVKEFFKEVFQKEIAWLSAFDILNLFFTRIFQSMYPETWRTDGPIREG